MKIFMVTPAEIKHINDFVYQVELNEEKVEDYDDLSKKGVLVRYFANKIMTFKDYRTSPIHSELISDRQRLIVSRDTHLSLVAYGLATDPDKVDNHIWIGDTGASCHMFAH